MRLRSTHIIAAAAAVLLGICAPSTRAQLVVDAGYTATPSTLIPAYEDTGGIELTDGNLGGAVWPDAATDAAPLTGWQNVDATATFNFTSPVTIGSIVAWFADSDGAAGVGLPESVRVTTTGGFDQLFAVPDPEGSGTTVGVELGGLNLTTDNVTLEIARNTGVNPDACCGIYEWTMLAEVQFFEPVNPDLPTLVAPQVIDLGTVPADPAVVAGQITVGNVATATSDLVISDISFVGADMSHFTPPAAPPGPLAGGDTAEVDFSFDSGGVPGTYGADLVIESNDIDSPTAIPVTVRVVVPLVPSTPYQEAVVASGPLVYWTFDEAGDTDNARDLINDVPENELIARGAATRGLSTMTAGGVSLGRAAAFDGASATRFDTADLSDALLPTGDLTQFVLETWFKSDSTDAQYLMETFSEAGLSNRSSLIYGFNGHSPAAPPAEFEIFAGLRSGTVVTDGPTDWHHAVVAHYGAGDVEIYIDGALTSLTFGSDYDSVQTFGRIAIGHTVQATTNGFQGLIDEFAIYDLTGFADDAARREQVAGIVQHYFVTDDPLGFRITDVARLPGNKISLTWTSRPGEIYTILWSTDATDFSSDAGDDIGSQGGSTTHVFDNPTVDFDNPLGAPTLLFKVSENP